MRPAMGALTLALAQTEADAQRLRGGRRDGGRGVRQPQVRHDARCRRCWRADAPGGPRSARPVVLAASTREGEEGALLAAWQPALAAMAGARRPLLLLVPRHPQRFDEVARLVAAAGLQLARRSDWPTGADPATGAGAADVWLGDSLGELPLYYACADVALLGGSFGGFGGQNLIEAAACGCPLLIGPSTYNFADAAERAIEAGAALRVSDLPAAVDAALALIGDARRLRDQADAALRFAAAHRGAAARMAAAIVRHLPPPG